MSQGNNIFLDEAVFAEAARFSAATLHEAAGQIGALPVVIKPLWSDLRVCGPACTITCPPGNNLWLHRAIYKASPGDVLVVSTGGDYVAGYWGEIMTHAALQRKIGGLVIDGYVRDAAALKQLGFPVFCRGLCIRGTAKDPLGTGRVNSAVKAGKVLIRSGDLVVGDEDGVVVIPAEHVPHTLIEARQREEAESRAIAEIGRGRTTLEILGFDGSWEGKESEA